jgi:hypothetical protein
MYPTHSLHLSRDSTTCIGSIGRVKPKGEGITKISTQEASPISVPISVVISPMDHCSIKIDATFIVGEFTFFVKLAIKTEHLLVGRGVTAYYNMPSSYTRK